MGERGVAVFGLPVKRNGGFNPHSNTTHYPVPGEMIFLLPRGTRTLARGEALRVVASVVYNDTDYPWTMYTVLLIARESPFFWVMVVRDMGYACSTYDHGAVWIYNPDGDIYKHENIVPAIGGQLQFGRTETFGYADLGGDY